MVDPSGEPTLAEAEHTILELLQKDGQISDTKELISHPQFQTAAFLDKVLKSLTADEYINLEVLQVKKHQLTAEGEEYAQNGTPEFQFASAIKKGEDVDLPTLKGKLGDKLCDIGFKQACKANLTAFTKEKKVQRLVDDLTDPVAEELRAIKANPDEGAHNAKKIEQLRLRKLVQTVTEKSYKVTKGENFSPVREKLETDLTSEMLRTGNWKDRKFKKYNFKAEGLPVHGGHQHPLLKVRQQFREIMFEMGFEEMPTNRFVESSFWNFDTLFVP